MSKYIGIILLCLSIQSCSLLGGGEYNPELDVVAPVLPGGGEYPEVKIGSQVQVQVNASVERDGLERVIISLYHRSNNRESLSALVYELDRRPESVFIDGLLEIPDDTAPSQDDRDYGIAITMEHGGGSITHNIPVVLIQE